MISSFSGDRYFVMRVNIIKQLEFNMMWHLSSLVRDTVLLSPSTWLIFLFTALSIDSTPVLIEHTNSLDVLGAQ